MTPQSQLIRAISAEFLRRKLKHVGIIVVGITVGTVLVSIWLVSMSLWWLLLSIPAVIICLIGTGILTAASTAVRVLRPVLTEAQDHDTKNFVDKLERVADTIQTPLFIIMYRVVRDMVRPRDTTFIQTVARDSTTLQTDLKSLRRSFPE